MFKRIMRLLFNIYKKKVVLKINNASLKSCHFLKVGKPKLFLRKRFFEASFEVLGLLCQSSS
jgi:glutathione peroxidase-family protein